MLLNVQLQIRCSTLKQFFRSVFQLLGYIYTFSDCCDQRTCNLTKHCSVVDASYSTESSLE